MKLDSIILPILGTILSIFGILPFIFNYPHSDSPDSGPSNLWELILMISYDGKGLHLFVGIALLVLSFFLIFRQRKLQV